MDIPASESPDDEPVADPVSNLDDALNPEHRLRKRGEEKPVVQTESGDKQAQEDIKKEAPLVPSNMVLLRGLNKVVGRVSTFEVPLGTVSTFENLEIIARKCVKSPPDERPENAALLEVREIKTGEEPKQIFLGWMLSSSPGLSALEHPVYDITVLSCENKKNLE